MTRLDGFGAHEPQAAQGPASHREALPDGLLERLKATAAQRGLPLKSLLLAAHCLTLHLFSRSDSVVTGAISNGRPELPDADRMVGLFLNTVPVRSEIAGCSWIEVADALFRQERDGHAHRRYPLSAIQQIVGDELSSAFNYVNLHVLEPLWQLRDFRVWGRNQLRPAGQRDRHAQRRHVPAHRQRRPRHQPQPGRADRRDLRRTPVAPRRASRRSRRLRLPRPSPRRRFPARAAGRRRQPVRTPGRGAAGQRRAGLRGATLDLSRPRPCGALRGHPPGSRAAAMRSEWR